MPAPLRETKAVYTTSPRSAHVAEASENIREGWDFHPPSLFFSGGARLSLWKPARELLMRRSGFVYFPLCSGISLLHTHAHTHTLQAPLRPAIYLASLPRPYTPRASQSHSEFCACFSAAPRHLHPFSHPPHGNLNRAESRGCKEVQKASAVLPYGLASDGMLTHARTVARREETAQVNTCTLPFTSGDLRAAGMLF